LLFCTCQKELSQLQAELEQQTAAYAQQIEVTAQRDSELNKLSNEALVTGQRFETEMKEKQAKIDKLLADINSFKTTENHLQSEIEALKEANEQLKADKAEQEAKSRHALNTQENQMTELKKRYNEIELECLNITKKLAEQSELEALKELQEVTIIIINKYLNFYKLSSICRRSWLNSKILCIRKKPTLLALNRITLI